jgi:hypothetical protein
MSTRNGPVTLDPAADEPPWSPALLELIAQHQQVWLCHDEDDADLVLRPDAGDLPALCIPLHRLNLLTPELLKPLRTILVIQRSDDGMDDGFYARYGVRLKQQLEAVLDETKTLHRILLNEITPTMPRLWSLVQEDRQRFQHELMNFQISSISEEISPKRPPQRTEQARPSEWPEPSPLPDALPPVEPFEPRLLPEAFRPWIEDIAERMQCPPDFPAVSAMVALATVVGRRVGIRPKHLDDWLVVPNLWGGVVGRPGLMKTPAIVEGVRPLWQLERDASKRYDEALAAWKAGELVAEERKKVVSGEIRDALKAQHSEEAQQLATELDPQTRKEGRRWRPFASMGDPWLTIRTMSSATGFCGDAAKVDAASNPIPCPSG